MGTGREELLQRLWEAQDEAYDLMAEYDSLPHRYGDNVLYQAEGHIIDLIADHPGITGHFAQDPQRLLPNRAKAAEKGMGASKQEPAKQPAV